MRWPDIVAEYQSLEDADLASFLDETGIPLSRLTKDERSWTQLQRDAGTLAQSASAMETAILKRNRAFAHIDDALRNTSYRRLLTGSEKYQDLSDHDRRLAEMLIFSVWPTGGDFTSLQDALDALRSEPDASDELLAITDYTFNSSRQQTLPMGDGLSSIPLRVHAHYQREEILAGLGTASMKSKPGHFREGVKYVADLNVDVFFINLIKTDEKFSPTTMYRDYPISQSLFHWQSQSTTSANTPPGAVTLTEPARYSYLFGTSSREFGPIPYMFLGPATIADHHGERPISITWKLDTPMPAEFFNTAKLAAG